jgi:hypothetical protein
MASSLKPETSLMIRAPARRALMATEALEVDAHRDFVRERGNHGLNTVPFGFSIHCGRSRARGLSANINPVGAFFNQPFSMTHAVAVEPAV